MKTLCLLFFAICLFSLSCTKEDTPPAPTLKIEKTEFTITSNGGSETTQITSNTKWEITGIPTWISINPSTGEGNTTITITITTNTNTKSRSADLILNASNTSPSTIRLTQAGANPDISIDKQVLNVLPTAGKDSVLVNANVPWKLDIPVYASSWIAADKINDTAGTSKIRFSISENASTLPRTAILTLVSTGATTTPVSLSINQDQPNVIITSFEHRGAGGENFTISGRGFSPLKSENVVKVNGITAVVVNATRTSLTVTTPPKSGSGKLIVTVNTKADTANNDFFYKWKGVVTTIAGGTKGDKDGVGTEAQFTGPTGIDIDKEGSIYVADYGNYKVRKISPGGTVTTLPGRTPINSYST